MQLYDWNRLPVEQLNPLVTRRMIHSGQMTIARLELQKGAAVPEHSHVNEQVCTVERGALDFTIDGGHQVVRAAKIGSLATTPICASEQASLSRDLSHDRKGAESQRTHESGNLPVLDSRPASRDVHIHFQAGGAHHVNQCVDCE
jgi:hypothetical protein